MFIYRIVANSLRSLDFSYNSLESVPFEALRQLKKLIWLNMHRWAEYFIIIIIIIFFNSIFKKITTKNCSGGLHISLFIRQSTWYICICFFKKKTFLSLLMCKAAYSWPSMCRKKEGDRGNVTHWYIYTFFFIFYRHIFTSLFVGLRIYIFTPSRSLFLYNYSVILSSAFSNKRRVD